MALSDLQIKKLVPRRQRFEVSDGQGLSIRIMPTGTKTWVFRYMIDGTARRMTLGPYPAIPLSEARELHAKAMQEVERGIDPGIKQQEAKATRKAAPTVADLLEEYWAMELKATPSGKARKRMVEKDALPHVASGRLRLLPVAMRFSWWTLCGSVRQSWRTGFRVFWCGCSTLRQSAASWSTPP